MNTNNTAPLTEVVAIVQKLNRNLAGIDPLGSQRLGYAAADMITTLAAENATLRASEAALTAQLAERDTELARVTNELAASRNEAVMNYVELTAATRRIAALTEALQSLMDLNDNYAPFGGELYRDRVDRTWDKARAALTTDKGPTT